MSILAIVSRMQQEAAEYARAAFDARDYPFKGCSLEEQWDVFDYHASMAASHYRACRLIMGIERPRGPTPEYLEQLHDEERLGQL